MQWARGVCVYPSMQWGTQEDVCPGGCLPRGCLLRGVYHPQPPGRNLPETTASVTVHILLECILVQSGVIWSG